MNKQKCEVEGCENQARYNLFKTLPDGSKVWLNVCEACGKVIGDENQKRAEAEYPYLR